MKKFLKFFSRTSFSALYLFLLFSATKVSAAGLVPCGPGTSGGACKLCDLFVLIKNVVDFIFEIGTAIAIVLIIFGGFTILTAGESPERMEKGRKTIIAAIIGLAIALGSWLIIDVVMKILVGGSPSEFGPWNQLPC